MPAPYNRKLGLSGFSYTAKVISIDNTGSSNVLSGQIKILLTASNFTFTNAMANGEDIRFTKGGSTTLLSYYIESWSASAATVWVSGANIAALSVENIYMYYGKPGSTSLSDPTIMYRFAISEPSSTYVVRFNDGSGTTPVNTGSAGGTLSIVGGVTWNANDILGGTTGSLTLNGTTGYVQRTGLLDTWSNSGSVHLAFKLNSTASDQTIISKVNRLSPGGGDNGDYVRVYFRASDSKIVMLFNVGTVLKTVVSSSTYTTGVRYYLTLTWNTKLIALGGGWLLGFINGIRELATYNQVSYPPAGSSAPFRIGAMSNLTTGAAEGFASILVNDFAVQTVQNLSPKVKSIHEFRTYYEKDEESKWVRSMTLDYGGVNATIGGEQTLYWDGSKFILFYDVFVSNQATIWRKEATVIVPNTPTTWTNDTQVLGHGVGGESGDAARSTMRKIGSTWYIYYRDALTPGIVYVVTSSDGLTFSGKTTVLTPPGSGVGSSGYYNMDVLDNRTTDGFVYMIADEVGGAIPGNFALGFAGASAPAGTFSFVGLNPKSTMNPGTVSVGSWGAPVINKIGNVYHVWYLANPAVGALPTYIYRAFSTDLNIWTITNLGQPLFNLELPAECDQVGDPFCVEVNSVSYFFYAAADNGSRGAPWTALIIGINVCKYNGPLSQLTKDLTITVNP